MLSFTAEVFFAHLASYNQAIWPAQIIAYGFGIAAAALTIWPRRGSDRFIGGVLAAAWIWIGLVYHLDHFARINFIAPAFAALFVLGGLLFGWTCAIRGRVAFRFRNNRYGWVGLAFLILAMIVYPLAAWSSGDLAQVQHIGVGPTATTCFTVGVLLLIEARTPYHLVVVPLLWLLAYGTMMWLLGEVPFLLSLGVLGYVTIVSRNRRSAAAAHAQD